MRNRKKIAVIGSGISGLSAAYFLKDTCDLYLYEKEEVLGGHSRTISIPSYSQEGRDVDVDTGFIVFNNKTYPHLNALFKNLDVEIEKTEMSFSVSSNQGALEWAGSSLRTLFAQKRNLFNPFFFKGILDILRFNRKARNLKEIDPNLILKDFIKKANLGRWFKENYLGPMGAAIWSCSANDILNFPALFFIKFFNNHGLLTINNNVQWYTVKKKSKSYVNKIKLSLKDKAKIKLNASIVSIEKLSDGVLIKFNDGLNEKFDEIIFSCHPKHILSLLEKPTKEEIDLLSQFSTNKNYVCVHNDKSFMPKRLKCWSSWNYLCSSLENTQKVCITYWMNKLQNIPFNNKNHIFVTLNPYKPIEDQYVYDRHFFEHPIFNQNTFELQEAVQKIQGKNHFWFCGAYLRSGFHEDGIWSAINVVEKINKALK